MSFWTNEKTVNGFNFIAHVSNPGLSCKESKLRGGDIDVIVPTDFNSQTSNGKAVLKELNNKYLNKDYKKWLLQNLDLIIRV